MLQAKLAMRGHYHMAFTNVSDGEPDPGSSLMLSSLGVGTYLGEPDAATDELVVAGLLHSLTRGWNVIDTASNYRGGAAERSVGEALSAALAGSAMDDFPTQSLPRPGGGISKDVPNTGDLTRDMVFVSSKAGFVDEAAAKKLLAQGAVRHADVVGGHCMHPACLKASLATSLERLQLQTLDLLYLHNPAEMQLVKLGRPAFMARLKAAFSALEEMRAAGQIKHYGLATWECFRVPESHPGHLRLESVVALAKEVGGAHHGFAFIQVPINPGMPEAWSEEWQRVGAEDATLLDTAHTLRVQVFASGPLMEAALVGKLGVRGAVVEELQNVAGEGAKLLQWARSTPGLLCALVGQKTRGHVASNVPLAKVPPLTEEQHAFAYARLRKVLTD